MNELFDWFVKFGDFAAKHPEIAGIIAVIGIFAYLILRSRGHDPIPVILYYFGIGSVDKAFDIAGQWEYYCKGHDRPEIHHGGDCDIQFVVTRFGVQWKLSGRRRWMLKDGKMQSMQEPYPWETDYAAVTDPSQALYTYHIKVNGKHVDGWGKTTIQKGEHGKPVKMSGEFFQVGPTHADSVNGIAEYRRMSKPDDFIWRPRMS